MNGKNKEEYENTGGKKKIFDIFFFFFFMKRLLIQVPCEVSLSHQDGITAKRE